MVVAVLAFWDVNCYLQLCVHECKLQALVSAPVGSGIRYGRILADSLGCPTDTEAEGIAEHSVSHILSTCNQLSPRITRKDPCAAMWCPAHKVQLINPRLSRRRDAEQPRLVDTRKVQEFGGMLPSKGALRGWAKWIINAKKLCIISAACISCCTFGMAFLHQSSFTCGLDSNKADLRWPTHHAPGDEEQLQYFRVISNLCSAPRRLCSERSFPSPHTACVYIC